MNYIITGLLIASTFPITAMRITPVQKLLTSRQKSLQESLFNQLEEERKQHGKEWKTTYNELINTSSEIPGRIKKITCSTCEDSVPFRNLKPHIRIHHLETLLGKRSKKIIGILDQLRASNPSACAWCEILFSRDMVKSHVPIHLFEPTKLPRKKELAPEVGESSPPFKKARKTGGRLTLKELLTDPSIPLDDDTLHGLNSTDTDPDDTDLSPESIKEWQASLRS